MLTGINFKFDLNQAPKAEPKTEPKKVDEYDSASGDGAMAVQNLDDKAFDSEVLSLRREALHSVFQLADDILSDDLDDDELPSDRLDAYLHVGDDEDDEENALLNEQIIQIKASNMSDALSSLGVEDEDILSAFGEDVDEADEAIQKIAEIVEMNMPKGEDLNDFITEFLYGGEDDLDEYDSAQVGKNKVRKTKFGQTLVYKGVKAIRQGKLTVVNKRVGNTQMKVKLSPKQKMALRKASMKAITPNAIKKRMKSLGKGRRLGIYKTKGI